MGGDRRVLVEGGVELPVAQQHDRRVLARRRRSGRAQALAERLEGRVERAHVELRRGRQVLAEHLPRGDRVGDPGWGAEVVLEHLERAVAVAHHVQPRDRDPRADLLADADQLALVVLGAVEAGGWDDARRDDPPLGVDVAHEQLQRAHALGDAGRQLAPFARVDHARDRVDAEVLRAALGRFERDAAPAAPARDGFAQLLQAAAADRLPDLAVVHGGVAAAGDPLLVGAAQLCRGHPPIVYPLCAPVIRRTSKRGLRRLDGAPRGATCVLVPTALFARAAFRLPIPSSGLRTAARSCPALRG